MRQRSADRLHAGLMRLAGIFTIAYWIEYFTTGKVRTSEDPAHVRFENAFPLADAYMAACLLTAARLLDRRRPAAVPVGIAAGSAMVYLAGMDVLYNLQHGKYRRMSREMALETLINVFSLLFGPFTMIRMWAARTRLGT